MLAGLERKGFFCFSLFLYCRKEFFFTVEFIIFLQQSAAVRQWSFHTHRSQDLNQASRVLSQQNSTVLYILSIVPDF